MRDTSNTLRIGTRKSQLALWQAEQVVAALPDGKATLCPTHTSGDRAKEQRLADIGGKGLFVKELEEALLQGEVDVAVHSAKDMPALLPDGLILSAALPREDARDALICRTADSIATLPHGATVGTSSPRRKAQLLRQRPDLNLIEFRGNVHTRLRKLEEGVADATLLAMAGLKRLGLFDSSYMHPVATDTLLPAGGQGAIAIECREDATNVRELLAPINDPATLTAITAERAVLAALEGSCYTPVGAHASMESETLTLKARLYAQDGSDMLEATATGTAQNAAAIGEQVGETLIAQDKHGLRHG